MFVECAPVSPRQIVNIDSPRSMYSFATVFLHSPGHYFLARSYLCLLHATAFARFGVIKWNCISVAATLCECEEMLPDANQEAASVLIFFFFFLNWCSANGQCQFFHWTVDSGSSSGARYNNCLAYMVQVYRNQLRHSIETNVICNWVVFNLFDLECWLRPPSVRSTRSVSAAKSQHCFRFV